MKKASITTYDVSVGSPLFSSLDAESVQRKVSKLFTLLGETKGVFVKEGSQGKQVFIKYLCEEDADRCVQEYNGVLFDGIPLNVRRLHKKETKPHVRDMENVQSKSLLKNPDIVPAVEPMPQANETEVQSSNSPPSWSQRQGTQTVVVTHVETPTLIWVQIVADDLVADQAAVASALGELCPTLSPITEKPESNKIYGCKFSEDGIWYRCQVRHFHNDKVKVQYIDFGNCEEVNWQSLVELPTELTTPKPFASKLLMHNIRYISSKESEATAYVREVTQSKYVTINPTFRLLESSNQFAEIFVDGIHLNQDMVDKGFAALKLPNKQQTRMDGGGRPSFQGDSLGGYSQDAGSSSFGGAGDGSKQLAGEVGKLKIAGSSSGFPSSNVSYSELKRNLERSNKEKEICNAELNALRGKMKSLQAEFTTITTKLQENNMAAQIQIATKLAEKVRNLRIQFPVDQESTPLDEAIQLVCNTDSLSNVSIKGYLELEETLNQYHSLQNQISQFKQGNVLQSLIDSRNATRKTLFEQVTTCIHEMEQLPFASRAQNLVQCTENLVSQFEKFAVIPIQNDVDLTSLLPEYQQIKSKRKQLFEEVREKTDYQKKVVLSAMEQLSKQLSLEANTTIVTDPSGIDLCGHLKLYIFYLQEELTVIDTEIAQGANFMATFLSALRRDLKSETLAINNLMRILSDYRTLHSDINGWLDTTPSTDKLLANRLSLKTLRSKLRHRLADKHDAEENNEDEELAEIEKDISTIQQEIHENLKVEQEELSQLARLVNSHFPELIAVNSDCGIDIQLAYNGLVKPSHELDHYQLLPVSKTASGLFYSTFAGQPVIISECLLSDGHHIGRDDFLGQLNAYRKISHPGLLLPDTIFFDKNNRHAYMQMRREGDILASYLEHKSLDNKEIHRIVKAVLEAVKVLHDCKILHGEINPLSIIYSKNGPVALLPPDFSCRAADRVKNKYTTENGLEFMALEMRTMLSGMEPTGPVDMYCIGLLLLWLHFPSTDIQFKNDGSLDLSQFSLDLSVSSLIKSLIISAPHLRPTADMVLHSHYILNIPSAEGSTKSQSPVPASMSHSVPSNLIISTPNLQQPPPALPTQSSVFHPQLPPSSVFFDPNQEEYLSSLASSNFKTNRIYPSHPLSLHSVFQPPPVLPDLSFRGDTHNDSSFQSQNYKSKEPSGFEAAAMHQENREDQERQAAAGSRQYSANFSQDNNGYSEGQTEEFAIGTFSLEDCNAVGGESKGRKITRELSEEKIVSGDEAEWEDEEEEDGNEENM